MTRQQYIAELHSLLGFMSDEDRQRTIEKYNRMFSKAADEEEFMQRLGTPTKVAIQLAGNYVPSTPEQRAAEDAEREMYEAQSALFDGGSVSESEMSAIAAVPAREEPETVIEEEIEEPAPAHKVRRVKGGMLVIYILLSLVIALPITLVLVLVGIPFAAAGIALGFAAIAAAPEFIGALSLFSDISLVVGAALVVLAVALVLLWFGLWLSITLAKLWIGGVFRLGAKLCTKEAEAV